MSHHLSQIRGEVQGVYADMEFWAEVRRRVLTDELSERAACREYELFGQAQGVVELPDRQR